MITKLDIYIFAKRHVDQPKNSNVTLQVKQIRLTDAPGRLAYSRLTFPILGFDTKEYRGLQRCLAPNLTQTLNIDNLASKIIHIDKARNELACIEPPCVRCCIGPE